MRTVPELYGARCHVADMIRVAARSAYAPLAAIVLAALASSIHAQPAPLGVSAFAAGEGHTCALTSANGVKCWGRNAEGQLGDHTTAPRLVAVDVAGLTSGVVQITAGGFHTCALTAELNAGDGGGVKCWGLNTFGQLGDDTTAPRLAPVPVLGLSTGAVAIAAGHDFTCAVTKAGGVKCWGDNDNGELGLGNVAPQLTAVDVPGVSNVKSIAAGWDHVCALSYAGTVVCWGRNIVGQLGDGTNTMRLTAVPVTGLAGSIVVAITAGDEHTCALTNAGGAKCWGNNAFGQLGDGTYTARSTPGDVPGLTSGVVQIVAGGQHTCALNSNGGVRCWGWNGNGQLGDGSVAWRPVPVDVVGLTSGATAIAGGQKHTCALTGTGGVLCWGADTEGQLGDAASGVDRVQPTSVNLQPFASFNYQGLWWNPAESGWGVNFAHQGDLIFASWFTYDVDGSPLWMVMTANRTGPNTYAGDLYRAVGPPFYASPFPSNQVVGTFVGTGTLTFADARNATFSYTIGGVTQSKAITRQVFGTPEPTCSWSADADLAGATNYQDLWWKEPHGSESGWGINLTHQGATIFATWYTYDVSGKGWWITAAATRVAPKAYAGKAFIAESGPAYNAPFDPAKVKPLEAGTLTLTFADGAHGTLDATILGTRVVKPIMRQSFGIVGAGTVCTPTEVITACKVVVTTGFTGDLDKTYDTGSGAAGGGDGGGGGGGAGAGAGEGKVLGGLVTVTRLSDGAALGAAVTDSQNGLITIRSCHADWPMLLTVTGQPGAKYYDEATNQLSDFGPGRVLHALVDQFDENVGLSTFSEAAYQYAINNYSPAAAAIARGAAPLKALGSVTGLTLYQVREANATILNELNRHLPTALQMTSLKSLPTPIDGSSATSALPRNRYGRAASALGGFAMMLGDYKPGSLHPVADTSQEMARDLTDGRIDGFALDGSVASLTGTPHYDRTRFSAALNVGANKLTKRFSSSGSNNLFADTPAFVEAMIFDNEVLQDFGMVDQRFEYASLDKNGNLNLARTDCGAAGSCGKPIVRITGFANSVKQIDQNIFGSGYIVRNNGQVMSWGPANCGMLGNNQQSDDAIDGPVSVSGISNFTSIAATNTAAVGRDANGNVYSWGADLYGILGLGSADKQAACNIFLYLGGNKTVAANMKPTKIPALANIVSLHSNQLSMFAIDVAGHVYGWGSGFYYDFGDGTRNDRSTPGPVPGLVNIKTLAFTFDTVFALRSDGHVVAWGLNQDATFGDGGNAPKPTPQLVPNVSGLVTLVGDQDAAVYGMTASGTMIYWGAPARGLPPTPTVLGYLPEIRDLKASRSFIYAYTRDGKVFAAASGALVQLPSGAVVPNFVDITPRLTAQ